MILDEPLSSLDWPAQERLMLILSRVIERRNALIVISLHDINLAMLYTQRLILLKQGAQVAYGETPEVLSAPHLEQAFNTAPLLIAHPYLPYAQRLPRGNKP
jgi:iron complex transport system ATP-binding protein